MPVNAPATGWIYKEGDLLRFKKEYFRSSVKSYEEPCPQEGVIYTVFRAENLEDGWQVVTLVELPGTERNPHIYNSGHFEKVGEGAVVESPVKIIDSKTWKSMSAEEQYAVVQEASREEKKGNRYRLYDENGQPLQYTGLRPKHRPYQKKQGKTR